MASRREFMEVGLTACALQLFLDPFAMALNPGVSAKGTAIPIYRIIFDERDPECRSFARESRGLGVTTLGFADGDVTGLWFEHLDRIWRSTAVTIAGLTRHGPMFVLETLAADHGMRVVFRGVHGRRTDGRMEHRLSGPVSALQASTKIGAHDNWSSHIATAITQCVPGCPREVRTTIGAQGQIDQEPRDLLYSWVIAPKSWI